MYWGKMCMQKLFGGSVRKPCVHTEKASKMKYKWPPTLSSGNTHTNEQNTHKRTKHTYIQFEKLKYFDCHITFKYLFMHN